MAKLEKRATGRAAILDATDDGYEWRWLVSVNEKAKKKERMQYVRCTEWPGLGWVGWARGGAVHKPPLDWSHTMWRLATAEEIAEAEGRISQIQELKAAAE